MTDEISAGARGRGVRPVLVSHTFGSLRTGMRDVSTRTVTQADVEAFADLPDEKRNDFDQRMVVLLRALQTEVPRAQLMLTAMAVDFRLRALGRLVETTYIQGCEFDISSGRPKVSTAALHVAADEPLVRNRAGLATFDVQRFKKRLLH